MGLVARLQSRHSQDISHGSRSGPNEVCISKLRTRCAHGLELFLEGEGSLVTGLEAKAVAGYLLTLFDEVRVEGFDVSGRGEFKRLFSFQISEGEEIHSIADEGRFEFVFDEGLGLPTKGRVITGEGRR